MDRPGSAWLGRERLDRARWALVGSGTASHGVTGQGTGSDEIFLVRRVQARQAGARTGMTSLAEDWSDVEGRGTTRRAGACLAAARQGPLRHGGARQARAGFSGEACGKPRCVEAWLGWRRLGLVRSGVARLGAVGFGTDGYDVASRDKSRRGMDGCGMTGDGMTRRAEVRSGKVRLAKARWGKTWQDRASYDVAWPEAAGQGHD